MRSETAIAALRDILYHIDLAEHFVTGLAVAEFRDDLRAVYAVTRCLEIISEASRRLPEDEGAAFFDSMAEHGRRRKRLPTRL
jgi:uncharacterized protein with HEPN domain